MILRALMRVDFSVEPVSLVVPGDSRLVARWAVRRVGAFDFVGSIQPLLSSSDGPLIVYAV